MVKLAAVDYPFEYENGIILKGFSTLLVATAKWETHSGTTFQWHFVHHNSDMSLSTYTDDEKFRICTENARSEFLELETVSNATRTFLGWCNSYQIQLHRMDPSKVKVTTLKDAKRSLVLKSIGINANLSKQPVAFGATATFEVQKGSIRYSRATRFHEMIATALTSPILLYGPDEERGWLIPRFYVLEFMAVVNLGKYGTPTELPNEESDLMMIRERLLKHLKSFKLTGLLKDDNHDNAYRNTFHLKELLCDLSQGLEWAEEHARRQRKLYLKDKIYGLEFYKLATRDRDHRMKAHTIGKEHGDWVKLLDEEAIKGVVFYKGLGDVIICESHTLRRCSNCLSVPKNQYYLVALISCLQHLREHGNLPVSGNWNFRASAFNSCSGSCSSWNHLLHTLAELTVVSNDHTHSGVIVFGKSPKRKNKVLSARRKLRRLVMDRWQPSQNNSPSQC